MRELAPLFVAAFAPRPVELHSHCTIGLAPLAYMEGLRGRASARSTPRSRRSRNGTSNPPAETTLRNLEAEGFSHALDLDALAAISEHFRELARDKGLPLGAPGRLRRRLLPPPDAGRDGHDDAPPCSRSMRRPELFDAALEEVTRVRAEMGYPIMVTPFSQFVATQAVMNVIAGERWAHVSDEMVALLPRPLLRAAGAAGPGGRPSACCRSPRAAELRELEPLAPRGRARALRVADLRRGAAAAADDAGGAGRRDGGRRAGERRAPAARPGRDPLVTLLRELARRESISYLRLEKGDDVVVWRRAA